MIKNITCTFFWNSKQLKANYSSFGKKTQFPVIPENQWLKTQAKENDGRNTENVENIGYIMKEILQILLVGQLAWSFSGRRITFLYFFNSVHKHIFKDCYIVFEATKKKNIWKKGILLSIQWLICWLVRNNMGEST